MEPRFSDNLQPGLTFGTGSILANPGTNVSMRWTSSGRRGTAATPRKSPGGTGAGSGAWPLIQTWQSSKSLTRTHLFYFRSLASSPIGATRSRNKTVSFCGCKSWMGREVDIALNFYFYPTATRIALGRLRRSNALLKICTAGAPQSSRITRRSSHVTRHMTHVTLFSSGLQFRMHSEHHMQWRHPHQRYRLYCCALVHVNCRDDDRCRHTPR